MATTDGVTTECITTDKNVVTNWGHLGDSNLSKTLKSTIILYTVDSKR